MQLVLLASKHMLMTTMHKLMTTMPMHMNRLVCDLSLSLKLA